MQRISTTTAISTRPVIKDDGTPGYFTDGSAATGLPGTVIDEVWMNGIQETLAYVIESTGLELNASDDTLLAAAISRLVTRSGGRLLGGQSFAASGTYSPPTTDTTAVFRVRMAGSGAGGSSTLAQGANNASVGGGGASGSYLDVWLTWAQLMGSSSATSVYVTIGTGGGSGADGGATYIGQSLSTALMAPGGLGPRGQDAGIYSTLSPGGLGGGYCVIPSGFIRLNCNRNGEQGGDGIILNPSQQGGPIQARSGRGGNGAFGVGGYSVGGSSPGLFGDTSAGGSGASSGVSTTGTVPAQAGSRGGDGYVVIECYTQVAA